MSIREDTRPIPIKLIGTGRILPVPFIPQDITKTNWCWAACAAMVLSAYYVNFGKQCDLAALGVGASSIDCCTPSTSAACDIALLGDDITNLWHANHIPAIHVPSFIFT